MRKKKWFGVIYKAKFKNGKIYIGQTTQSLNVRKGQHLTHLYESTVFHKAIIKYGKDSVTWSIIDSAENISELNEKESYWISHYNSYIHAENSNGYNMTLGGEGMLGCKHSKETKEKISRGRLGENNPFYGKHHSRKTKELLSRAHSGKNNFFYGMRHSRDFLIRRSRNSLGEKNPSSKLTKEDVINIKILLREGILLQKEIAEKYKVRPNTISRIKTGATWSHVTLPPLNKTHE